MIDIRVIKVTEFPDQSALESGKQFNAMQTPTNSAFDATWSYSRNAKLWVTDFINIGCGKIVTFSILDKFISVRFVNYKTTTGHIEACCCLIFL